MGVDFILCHLRAIGALGHWVFLDVSVIGVVACLPTLGGVDLLLVGGG